MMGTPPPIGLRCFGLFGGQCFNVVAARKDEDFWIICGCCISLLPLPVAEEDINLAYINLAYISRHGFSNTQLTEKRLVDWWVPPIIQTIMEVFKQLM